jgi:Holliday junction resolvase-like predicted endonuclease
MVLTVAFLADQIREFVVKHFIEPGIQRGEKELRIKAGDVARAMNLTGRMPAICSALRSSEMRRLVRERLGVDVEIKEIRRENVKRDSSTNVYVFKIIEKSTKSSDTTQQEVIGLRVRENKPQQADWSYENEWFEETNVARKIVAWLEKKGWTILRFNEDKRQRGPDIVAVKEGRKMIIEVKGYPSDKYVRGEKKGQKKPTPPNLQAKHWFAEAILTIIREKHREPSSTVAIGLPRKSVYLKLISEVKDVICRCLDIVFILVSKNEEINTLTCQ